MFSETVKTTEGETTIIVKPDGDRVFVAIYSDYSALAWNLSKEEVVIVKRLLDNVL